MSGDPRVVILGAGPSGLGTALGVALNGRGLKTVTIEKNDRPGGLAGSFRWKDHTLDYGPHRLSPNSDTVYVLAEDLLGPDLIMKRNQHGAHLGGKLFQFPPRVSDWATPWALWQLSAFAWSFFIAKLAWVPRRFEADTFEKIIVRKFGRRFYRLIAAPMSEKVWGPPETFDPNFANQRFAMVDPKEVLKRVIFPKQELNPANFYYPRKGFQQLWDNMAAFVERQGHSILYNAAPRRLQVEKGRITAVSVATPAGEKTISGEDLTVVSTIPIFSLVNMIDGLATEPMKELLAAVRFRSMLLVAFEFEGDKTLPYRVLFYPEKRFCFNRLCEQNEFSRETVAPGRSVVIADITVTRGDPGLSRPDSEIIARAKEDLARLPYIDLSRLIDAHVERVEFAYPVPDIQSRKNLFEVSHQLKQISNLELLGRFSIGDYDNSDYALEHGLDLSAMISGQSTRLEYMRAVNRQKGRSIVL